MTVQVTEITEDEIRDLVYNIIYLNNQNYNIYEHITTILNCNMTNKQAIALHRFVSHVQRACDIEFSKSVH